MSISKEKFVKYYLGWLVTGINPDLWGCTYIKKGDKEYVYVWADIGGEPNCGLPVNVTGKSLAQMTIDVIKEAVI